MAIHQVLVDTACGFVKASVKFVDVVRTLDGDGRDVNERLAVGSQLKAFKATLAFRNDTLFLVVEIHRENLVAATEHNGVVVHPYGVELTLCSGGQTLAVAAIDRHKVELCVVLVLLHIGIANGVEHLLTVGADSILAHHAKAPHHLRGEATVLDLDLWFLNDKLVVVALLRAGTYKCYRSETDK